MNSSWQSFFLMRRNLLLPSTSWNFGLFETRWNSLSIAILVYGHRRENSQRCTRYFSSKTLRVWCVYHQSYLFYFDYWSIFELIYCDQLVIKHLIEFISYKIYIQQNSDCLLDIKATKMKKVSWLRLILLICGISLAVGENLKRNNGILMASNDSATNKGLFFTIFF